MPNQQNLIVPLTVDALCVGMDDASRVTVNFAGPTIDFSRAPYLDEDDKPIFHVHRAATGKTLLRSLSEQSSDALRQGIHLHWSLPAALTGGAQTFRLPAAALPRIRRKVPAEVLEKLTPLRDRFFESESAFVAALKEQLGDEALARCHATLMGVAENSLVFPPAPNRWLITRGEVRGGALVPLKRWVLESDHLMTTSAYETVYQATKRGSVTVPVEPVPRKPEVCAPFRFMGRVFDAATWKEGDAPGAEYLANLSALGAGGPAFAAYHPDSFSVFGFHDTFVGEPLPVAGASLSYHVAGWYSDSRKDPVARVGIQALRTEYGWDFEAAAEPSRTILSGGVSDVCWDPERNPLSAERPLRDVKVAVGHTTTEALSALISREWLEREGARADSAGRSHVEALLDALQLGLLAKLGPQFGLPKLEEALHQSGFGSSAGGHLWTIRNRSSPPLEVQPEEGRPAAEAPGVAAALNELNALQQRYDALVFELSSRREQLFFDWYKYIHTLYSDEPTPSAEEKLNDQTLFLFQKAEAIRRAEERAGTVFFNPEQSSFSTSSRPESLARQILDAAAKLTASLEETPFVLERTGAPRFWQPQEPVLLMSGEELRATERLGRGGPLACRLSATGPETLALEEGVGPTWAPSWRPVFLHWRVRYRPVVASTDRKYQPKFLTEAFSLDADAIDYAIKPGPPLGEEYYAGTSLVSSRASFTLADQIRRYVKTVPDEDVAQRLGALVGVVESLPLMSQGLNGLNQAFLMREQTLQARVGDPTGPERNLSDTVVREAVGDMNTAAPLPFNGFSPLRGGFLEVAEVQLIDAFGRRAILRDPPLIRSERMSAAPDPAPAYLAPRLSQPSRLLFRWLDAENDGLELATSPATTPICGWLMPNHLDGSVMVYDHAGRAAGSLGVEGKKEALVWRRPPGPGERGSIEALNPHLLSFVRMFAGQGTPGGGPRKSKAFFAGMLEAVEACQAHHIPSGDPLLSLAVLVGRPIALVRASLRLELRGLPACDLSWAAFNADVKKALVQDDDGGVRYDASKRDSGGFREVELPVRLGDPSQSDDGLLGFFVESDPSKTFYSGGARPRGDPGVKAPTGGELHVDGSSSEVRVTLLMDPRGKVHATVGLLPVKSIDLPVESWAPALERIEAAFFTSPVLSRHEGLVVPLPRESGFAWSWVTTGAPAEPLMENASDDRARPSGGPLRIREGWLKLTKTAKGNPGENA